MMLEVTVKTLDSQNHNFCVRDEITVKEFKEEISPTLNIPADKQRLIFCGKVLKDEKRLIEYGVDGKVVHVVQSLPPQSTSSSASSSSSSTTTSSSRGGGPRDAAGFLLGAFTIPQDLIDPTQVQNIVQEVVSGMGEIGRNATVMSRTSDDGSSVDVHINLGQLPMQSEAQLRMNRVQTMLLRANRILGFLEDGSNGQNNGNSADFSSQTEEAEDLRVSPMEIDLGSLNSVDNGVSNPTVDSTTSSDAPRSNNIEVIDLEGYVPPPASNTSERRSSFPERYRFEGLASAAQAAISAAIATAAAAARVATASVSGGTSTAASEPVSNTNSTDSEPMDLSAAADSLRLISDHFLQNATTAAGLSTARSNAETVPIRLDIEGTIENAVSELGGEPETTSSGGETRPPASEGESRTNAPPSRREATQPSVQTLANLLDDVIRLNTRLEPCLERCRDLIRRDPPLFGRQLSDAHRLFSRISQLLHFMSHAYHSLSDLHINFSQNPPRSPRVRIISSAHGSSIIHAGIPLQAQISVTSGVLTPPSSSTTTTANTASAENAPSTNMPPQSTPRSTNETATNTASSALPSMASVLRNQNPVFFMEVSPSSVSFTSAEVGRIHAPRVNVPTGRDGARPTDADNISSSNQTNAVPNQTNSIPNQTNAGPNQTNVGSSLPNVGSSLPNAGASQPPNAGASQTNVGPSQTNVGPSQPNAGTSQPNAGPNQTNAGPNQPNAGPNQTNAGPNQTNAGPNQTNTGANQTNSGRPSANVNFTAGQGHPLINLPFRNMIPVPLTSIGSVQAFDAGLPCHSVWALEPSRRRHNAGGSRTPAGIQIGLTPNVPGRQEEQLTQVISNIMMSLLNHPNVPPSGAQAAGTFTFSSAGNSAEAHRAARILFDSHENLRRIGRSETGLSSHEFTDLNEVEFIRFMSDLFAACNGLQLISLSDILSDYCVSILERDRLGRFGNLLWFIASYLSVYDFMELYKGNFRPINRLEFPLKMYLLDMFFDGGSRTPDEEAINALMDEFVADFAPALEYFSKKVTVMPGCDFKRRISEYLKKFGCEILKAVLAVPGHQFTDGYPAYGRRAFRECLKMLETLLQGGRQSFERVLVNSVQGLHIPPVLKRTMFGLISRSMLCTPLDEFSLECLHTDAPGVSSSRDFLGSDARGGDRKDSPKQKDSKKEPPVSTRSREPADGQENGTAPTLAAFARLAERTSALLRNTSRPEDDNIAEVVIGSQTWHNTLPREWVPIITRDVQRQRRQAPQTPFSNAYMSGMPSKRRKIMTTGSTPLLGTSQGTLSELLLQAVQSTGVRPNTSPEELRREASRDSSLQASFEQHLKGAIQERLHRDLDYCSERFPNAEKYFIERL